MTRFVGYIAMSIDGRIADADGSVDWLKPFTDERNDYEFADFFEDIDAIVMGRKTYDFVASQPVWPYQDMISYVVTSRLIPSVAPNIETIAPDFDALRQHLINEDLVTVWVMGGGQTQRGALDADMFDELRLFIMPLVLGGGPLVFGDGAMTNATLSDHAVLPGGVVCLTYLF